MGRKKIINRKGEKKYNKYGTMCEIVKYDDANNIVIKFEDGSEKSTDYRSFEKGITSSVNDITVLGVGYIGEGIYDSKDYQYRLWSNLLKRCYKPNNVAYKDVRVCAQWHNYQNFAEWCEENFYSIANEKMELDKDILSKGNKVYSPKNCCFVPQRINKLIKTTSRNSNLPPGVSLSDGGFQVHATLKGKRKYLGYFRSKVDAFYCYKEAKENEIARVADEYKARIPFNVYVALTSWNIEIDD